MNNKYLLTASIALSCAFLSAQTGDPHHDEWWEHEREHYHESGYDSPNSPTAVTEGHPITTTSFAASEAAQGSAFVTITQIEEAFVDEPADTTQQTTEAAASTASSGLDIDFGTGRATIDGVDVDFFTLRVPYSRKLTDRGTLQLNLPISLTNVKDIMRDDGTIGNARVYGGGINVGYLHRVFMKADNVPYRWNVTPTAGIYLRESSGLNQGSWVYNFGLSSSFAYRLNENWVINVGNSVSFAFNNGRKDFPDPIRDNQQVVINGLQVFYLAGRWSPYAYIMDTRFLRSALVSNFQSYGVGVSFRITRNRSFKATVVYEDGSRYDSLRATFGSSWKF